jgi:hypothetical protein
MARLTALSCCTVTATSAVRRGMLLARTAISPTSVKIETMIVIILPCLVADGQHEPSPALSP